MILRVGGGEMVSVFCGAQKFRNHDPCRSVLPQSPVQETWDGFLP